MVVLDFKDLSFSEDTKEKDRIKVIFLNIYYFYLDKRDLLSIGDFKLDRNSIDFKSEKKEGNVRQKFSYILSKGFNGLKSSINGKPALYIHSNSGIPLIGSNEFGIIDRGTNTIEIKPLTTCNIDCIFCSVDHTKRLSDVIVERVYLVEELEKVIKLKKEKVNIHIGSQGDPSLYGDLEGLVASLRANPQINAISMVTNGILITKERAERLIKAGMTHFHFSLHTLNQEMADKLANSKYPVKKVMDVCRYISESKRAHVLLVPVWLPGINDKDIEDVVLFSKDIGADIGIQNFLEYDFGKHPVNGFPMKLFFEKLKELELKLNIDLSSLSSDLRIIPDTKLPKPFRKGDVISVEIKAKDRLKNSVIAVAQGRVVSVINCQKTEGNIKVRLIRDKDNIFIGTPMIR